MSLLQFLAADGFNRKSVSDASGLPVRIMSGSISLDPGNLATLAEQQAQTALLSQNVTGFALADTADTLWSDAVRSGAGEQLMLAAGAAGVSHRIHRYSIIVPGAGYVEIRDGAGGSVKRRHRFTAANMGIDRVFDAARPYAISSDATALYFYWSGTGDAHIEFDYVSN